MNRTIAFYAVAFATMAALLGCKNNKSEPSRTDSTRQAAAAQPSGAVKMTCFGEPTKLRDSDAIPLTIVLADPAKYEGKYVRLVGQVDKVCTSKGCWLEMSDPATRQALFVKFTCPIEGRLIPMEALGKSVVVEGTVMVKEISEEEARHLKEESGAPASEVAKIKGPQKQITLSSPAAQIAGL